MSPNYLRAIRSIRTIMQMKFSWMLSENFIRPIWPNRLHYSGNRHPSDSLSKTSAPKIISPSIQTIIGNTLLRKCTLIHCFLTLFLFLLCRSHPFPLIRLTLSSPNRPIRANHSIPDVSPSSSVTSVLRLVSPRRMRWLPGSLRRLHVERGWTTFFICHLPCLRQAHQQVKRATRDSPTRSTRGSPSSHRPSSLTNITST